MASSRDVDLANPEAALASYLDELLHTATDAARVEEAPKPVQPPVQEAAPVAEPAVKAAAAPDAAKPVRKPLPVQASEPKVVPEPKPVIPAQPDMAVEPKAVQPTGTVAEEKSPDAPSGVPPVGRPDWSESPFECLIFRVAGLKLAVPLILLGAIHRLEQGVKPIPGSPRWYMGMLPEKDHNLRVVDSAEWIMAGRVPPNTRDNYRFVIRLDNSEWALACDDVAQSFTLSPDDVRWRTSRSKRPWLAGTVIKQMCALIDVGTMAHLLAQAERDHHLNIE